MIDIQIYDSSTLDYFNPFVNDNIDAEHETWLIFADVLF